MSLHCPMTNCDWMLNFPDNLSIATLVKHMQKDHTSAEIIEELLRARSKEVIQKERRNK